MAERIAAAAAEVRAEDSATIHQARDRIDKAAGRMELPADKAATFREQCRHLLWVAIGGLLAGMLLWPVLPGFIARIMPTSWYWPERMAARTLNLDRWAAGARLLATSDPERWRTMVVANAILQVNRNSIVRCRDLAAKTRKAVRCTIEIGFAYRPRPPGLRPHREALFPFPSHGGRHTPKSDNNLTPLLQVAQADTILLRRIIDRR
jgi:hypothetical protein